MKKKRAVRSTIKVRTYSLVCDAVLGGVESGWRRAHKHTNTPDEETIKSTIYDAVTCALSDTLDFGDDY